MPKNEVADLPSAKVRPSDREGVDGWVHFHAAYSRRFATSALEAIAEPGDLILDPFCGVGTTARAAASVGCRSLSLDMNPAMVRLARGTLASPSGASSVIRGLRGAQGLNGAYRPGVNGLTSQWLEESTGASLAYYRRLLRDKRRSQQGRYFAEALLVSSATEVISPDVGSNPTWPKPPGEPEEKDVRKLLLSRALEMRDDLREFGRQVQEPRHEFGVGDAKKLPLGDGCVDATLTSPPYLSRIDYVRATLPELLALGYDDPREVRQLRQAIMGGVLSKRTAERDSPGWGDFTKQLLARISSHTSKASSTYYSTLARRYFADLDVAVGETLRVLKPGGTALFVVQTSYYKDVCIPLHDVLIELAENRGAEGMVAEAEKVRQHFGHLSPHQRKYVPKKELEETVVSLRKPP